MSKKIINGTINYRSRNFHCCITKRILEDFTFYYDPANRAVHLIPITVDDVQTQDTSDFFIKNLDLSYVKKNDKLIFLLQFEGWMHFLTFLNNSLRQFCPFLNFENVFLASEQLNFFDLKKHEKPNINHLSILAQDTWMPDVNAAIKIPHSYELKDKLFLCYNNRTAPHRCQLVSLMNSKDMIKDSFVSLNVEKAHESITNDAFLTETQKNKFITNLPKFNLEIEPWVLNSDSRNEYIKYVRNHARSMISIVTETHWYDSELSFTEKIYRPLSLGHPFIVVGNIGFLKKLREFGFKTFDGIINEKYDLISNPHQRLSEIFSEMQKIQNMSDDQRKPMWKKLNDIAEYNREHFYKKEFIKNTSLYNFLFQEYENQLQRKNTIYTTKDRDVLPYFFKNIIIEKNASNQNIENKLIYHNVYDGDIADIPLSDDFWKDFKEIKGAKFLYDRNCETIDPEYFSSIFSSIIKTHQLHPRQFYIILPDEQHCESLLTAFNKKDIQGINVDHFNTLLYNIPIINSSVNNEKRFSIFSRAYKLDRLKLYLDLAANDLLTQFNYTFSNIDPYKKTITSLDDIKNEISGSYTGHTEKLFQWISGIPYTLENDQNVDDIYSSHITSKLLSSGINIINETIFTPVCKNDVSWITEKTYKAISCKKPFIMYNTPFSLKTIKKMGFKTFNEYINEDYDLIENGDSRRQHIVSEIKRLSLMSDHDFNMLLQKCDDICKYNYDVFLLKRRKKAWTPQFFFLGIFE